VAPEVTPTITLSTVIPGLDPGTQRIRLVHRPAGRPRDLGGRVKPGHDGAD